MFTPRISLPEHMLQSEGRWIVVDERQQILLVDGRFPLGDSSPVSGSSTHLLGLENGVPIWAVSAAQSGSKAVEFDEDTERGTGLSNGQQWVSLRSLFGMVSDSDWVLAGRASQVLVWERDHRFCGRCGVETEHHPIDRAKQCPSCKLMAFPRISPAVIMLVERQGPSGPEVLLAWGRQFPGRFYSALAGFVEPGESLEECVVREVMEETAIEVDDVRYFASQPWPFPHSMMIGFLANYVGGEISIQEEEIVEAGWYGPDNLPPVPMGGMSIAGWMIEDWLKRVNEDR